MPSPAPLIIEAAINGATMKDTQPHVPRTVAEIVADALACLEAGASIVHHHTDDGAPRRAARDRAVPRRVDRHPRRGPRRDPLSDDGRRRRSHDDPANATPTSRSSPSSVCSRLALVDPGLGEPRSARPGRPPDGDRPRLPEHLRRRAVHVRRLRRPRPRRPRLDLRARLPADRARLPCPPAACRPRRSSSTSGATRCRSACRRRRRASRRISRCSPGSDLPWMVGVIGGDVDADRSRRSRSSAAATCASGSRTTSGPRQPRNAELVRAIVAMAERAGRRCRYAARGGRDPAPAAGGR